MDEYDEYEAHHGSHLDDIDPELDPALQLTLDSPSLANGLGDNFGVFGSSLGDSLGSELDFEDHSLHFNSGSVDQNAAHHLGSLGDALRLEPPSTPLRRSRGAGAGAPSSNRLSLAFELASADAPASTSDRELLRSLGIEEEDEEGEETYDDEDGHDGQGYSTGDDESGYKKKVNDSGYGGGSGSGSPTQTVARSSGLPTSAFAPTGEIPSPGRRSRGHTSSISLSSSLHEPLSGDSSPPIGAAVMSREESDAAFLAASMTLEESLKTTGVFLAHLRQHTTTEVAFQPPLSPSPNSHPTTLSSSPPPAAPSFNGSSQLELESASQGYADRQPVLEHLASSVTRRMFEATKERESQLRELAEFERLVSRNDPGMKAFLSSLDELPSDDDLDRSTTSESDQDSTSMPTPRASSGPSFASSSGISSFPSAVRIELSNLRDITSSLVNALSSINELTQVNNASVGEAGRKLRALRGHILAAREELISVERSEDFIREYEKTERAKGWYSERAREQMKAAEKALDNGWLKATEVLAPA
ncbi:hypothetical protein T439DRAFT_321684 [Meredithblackwellia eburnea MCA 4105]